MSTTATAFVAGFQRASVPRVRGPSTVFSRRRVDEFARPCRRRAARELENCTRGFVASEQTLSERTGLAEVKIG